VLRAGWEPSAAVLPRRVSGRFRGAAGGPGGQGGRLEVVEAAYEPYWKVQGKKMLLEFGQEFLLEFGINLAINGISAAINNKPFTGQDVLKSFANAAVSTGIKTGATTLLNDRPFSWSPAAKATFGNIDSGKHPNMRPFNSDKHWRNEWAGNESPIRWRSGIYDYTFNTLLSPVSNFVNGSMNAAVWGVPTAGGSVVLSGLDAVIIGGIQAFGGLTMAAGVGAIKSTALNLLNGRQIHRYGVAEYALQGVFKFWEKSFTTFLVTPAMRNAWVSHLLQPPPPPPPSA